MADVLAALQAANAPSNGSNAPVDVLSALQSAGEGDTPPPPGPPPTTGQRFEQGLADTAYGLGRLTQHIIPGPLNAVRSVLGMDPVSTDQWDQMATQREQQYDQARAAAGQTGIDWWRIAGNVADPINYLAPEAAPETIGGRIALGAGQGSALGAVQAASTSTTPGGLWWDTAKGALMNGLLSMGVSGTLETAVPAVRVALNKVRGLVKSGTVDSGTAADQVVKSALQSTGHDPSTVDLNTLNGLREDAKSALDHGADISPQSVANRAIAESLPVPVRLTRGQATGDAMQFAREQNLRGIQGVGEPLTNRLTEQNAAFIQNLDALGAKDALDPVSLGTKYADKIQQTWDGLQARKNALYAAVRNSSGQSAAMDGVAAADNIKAALDTPQASHAYDLLPANIQRTIDDLGSGETPFTVAQMQSLDKIWGDAARGADGSTAHAINIARRILGEAPIADDAGQESLAAYAAARQAHAQQMSLIDPKLPNGMPNPNYQPLIKSVVVDGKPPEKLFSDNFMNAAPSVAAKNLKFLSQIDPGAPKDIGQTVMGEIKRQALNSASAERGTVSEAALRGWANDPVKSARMDALLPQSNVQTFRNLAHTVETAKKFPVASAVNTSNTGSAVVNAGMSMLKNSAVGQVFKNLPLVRGVAEGLNAAKTQTDIAAALKPGVTLKSLLTATPAQAARNRLLTTAVIPAAVAAQQASQGSQQ